MVARKKAQKPTRYWQVTIKATVTTDIEVTERPAWAESMEDAVSEVRELFVMQNRGCKISSIMVEPNPRLSYNRPVESDGEVKE